MKVFVLPSRGETQRISEAEAIEGLTSGTISRILLNDGEKSAEIEKFICGNYAPFQIFDTKKHHVDAVSNATEAVELAKLNIETEPIV